MTTWSLPTIEMIITNFGATLDTNDQMIIHKIELLTAGKFIVTKLPFLLLPLGHNSLKKRDFDVTLRKKEALTVQIYTSEVPMPGHTRLSLSAVLCAKSVRPAHLQWATLYCTLHQNLYSRVSRILGPV